MSHFKPLLSLFLFFLILKFPQTTLSQRGQWQVLQTNIGISAMHMQLLNNDNVIIFDRSDFGPSNITLPAQQCYPSPTGTDCTAHSVNFNVLTNTINALNIVSDTWCSSGTTLNDGVLLQSGGFWYGERTIRTIEPCSNCDWKEFHDQLFVKRWYATNHILPDNRVIIIGGRGEFNYEFYPKSELFDLPFLLQTFVNGAENNLYPYVFLNVDGNLFIFANNRAILFDYINNRVVRSYPTIPDGEPRSYPSTGSAVLLPLKNLELGLEVRAEVLICGGAPSGAFQLANSSGVFKPALDTCARIVITDPNPNWVIEQMPMARTMGDMVILPNGDVTIINGAGYGCAGWELGRNPILNPVIYHPDSTSGPRFEVMTPTTIPRMYHSTAILLRDGRVLVGGSNPHEFYNFTSDLFPTDLSLEAFSPPYLDPSNFGLRPTIYVPSPNARITYGSNLVVNFSVYGVIHPDLIKVTMIRPGFTTHSFSMSQRMVVLTNTKPVMPTGRWWFQVNVATPGSANIAPPGYYMLFVVHQDIPSEGVWVQLL